MVPAFLISHPNPLDRPPPAGVVAPLANNYAYGLVAARVERQASCPCHRADRGNCGVRLPCRRSPCRWAATDDAIRRHRVRCAPRATSARRHSQSPTCGPGGLRGPAPRTRPLRRSGVSGRHADGRRCLHQPSGIRRRRERLTRSTLRADFVQRVCAQASVSGSAFVGDPSLCREGAVSPRRAAACRTHVQSPGRGT